MVRAALLVLALATLAGCETVKGAGRDLSHAGAVVGHAVEGSAQAVQNAL